MASKADRFYFTNFIEAAEHACRAAEYLTECLENFQAGEIGHMLETMHGIEHGADQKKHQMSLALAKAFVTPFDREDLAGISQSIDEVTDKVEEVLQRFYIGQIQSVAPEAVEFGRKICGICGLMKDMMGELENFKKAERLHEIIVAINQAEEDCDRFYLEAVRKIRGTYQDVFDVFSWREIFDYMENCADACEHVADSVETIVMKNT